MTGRTAARKVNPGRSGGSPKACFDFKKRRRSCGACGDNRSELLSPSENRLPTLWFAIRFYLVNAPVHLQHSLIRTREMRGTFVPPRSE
ncbi:hypothetical protein BV898_09616 [Hypsibius exemplaris]|uniref:Uncharacterized protein n=1 Tax=Hypsibius exemplaris TaxID=2072580 RepID=A0A1W0WM76_HYPEX|nr:hypothetical protein BV898_09616 [Hypsibius exemplaris]